MFKHFFWFEIKYVLKQPMIYIFLSLMTLMVFGAVASDNVQIGGSVGNIYKNSPHVITIYTAIMSIFGLLIATAFFNNAALRDHNYTFNEILFSTPLNKAGYFFGRFFGAWFLATIPLLGVFLGVILGANLAPALGWLDPDRIGPFQWTVFTNNYLLFILPNMFFAGTIIYALASRWRNTTISFLGALLIIVGYIVAGTFMSDMDNETLAALTDTFGIRAYSIYSKYYTPIEKNTLSPAFSGLLLANRLIWMSLGSLILLLTYFTFSFQKKHKKAKKKRNNINLDKQLLKGENIVKYLVLQPNVQAEFTAQTTWLQFKSFFYTSFLSITRGVTFKTLFLFSAIILVANLMGGFEYFGLQSYPVTYKVIDVINNAVGIFVIIILIFFSGELVWRDRDNKINEVVDATPHTSFISLIAKALSLIVITSLLDFFFIFCGVMYQLFNGFYQIELDVYLLNFLYINLLFYIIWSGVMIGIQVLSSNKYIGYFISILVVFIWSIVLSVWGVESNMLLLGATPDLSYSDMNGFGPGFLGAMWFNLYWILFALIFLLIAGALWNRGVGTNSLWQRIKTIYPQLSTSYKTALFVTTIAWALVAVFVFYNTQILNDYDTSETRKKLQAKYEKTYKKYGNAQLPKIKDVTYHIDIFPKKEAVHVKADLLLTNETDQAIDSLHYTIDDDWEPQFNIPNAQLIHEDKELSYQIYQLSPPLAIGDSMEITIKTKYIKKGFGNTRGNTNIIENGTFLNNFAILPTMGYLESVELSDKNDRKKHDLAPKDRMPTLESNCSAKCLSNYLSNGHSDYLNIETFISTADDQTAVAPGSLLKKWTENGRNHYHYKVDHPSQHFCSFISARYEVATRQWNGIDIEVYYDAKHEVNVPKMLDAVERSLAYFTKHFGPYYHKQCRIIEFPRYASFAQAFPGTMPYSEAIGFVTNLEEAENSIVDAVIAHEMAHQWWAHQVVGANMQGGTMMSESFAEYSSLMTMKHLTDNPMRMREFLKYDHDRYLRGRSSEVDKELPLFKVENQGHIHYGKGSIILYALQDYIGEDKVNTALRNFLDAYKYQPPPYPTSLDFLKYLEPQVPDSLQYLINDWFKEITLYDNRLKSATYEELTNGKYAVKMEVEAHKIKADTIGNETRMPIDDWIDIGVFADRAEKRLLYQKRVKIDKPKMTFSFEVDSLPVKGAIDPRRILIDRVYSDNIKVF